MEEWEGSDEGGWGGMGWGGREEEVMSVQVSRTNKRTKLQKKRDHNHNKSKVPCASISFFLFCFVFACLLYYKKKSQEETDTIYITSEFTAAQMSSATRVSNPTRHGSRRRPLLPPTVRQIHGEADPGGAAGGRGGSRRRLCSRGGCAFGH